MDISEENAAHEGPTLDEIFLKDCSLWGSHAEAQERWGGRSSREKPLCTDLDPVRITFGQGGWVGESGVKCEIESEKGEERCWLMFVFLFPKHKLKFAITLYFNWQ